MGDSALILSHRLSEWCGHGPVLEEDLAQANVALDLLGHARQWLGLAAEVEKAGRREDDLAYGRDAGEYRNLLLVEQPNGDYAQTMMRQFLFDAWHCAGLRRLAQLSGEAPRPRMAAIAAKAATEAAYHLRRSRDWVRRLGDGTEESHRRMQSAAERLWPFTGEMLSGDEVDGEFYDPAELRQPWWDEVRSTFEAATLPWPADLSPAGVAWDQAGGKCGRHTEHLGYLLAEMQFLQRAYPGAQW